MDTEDKKEYSCGAVLYCRDEEDEVRYLLIRQCRDAVYYGFPKGHIEAGESELAAARREIGEEVGLAPTFEDGFRQVIEYSLPQKPGVTKQVVFFLAHFDIDDPVTIQPEEISDCVLVPYGRAMELLRPNTQRVLCAANARVTGV